MKKILCFFAVFCLFLAGVFVCNKTPVRAQEDEVLLTNSNFVQSLQVLSSKNYVLMEDITLQTWQPMQISGININGNGFCITTPAPLFSVVDNGSKISNLRVKAAINFVFNPTPQVQNFGLLACDAKGATFENVVVTATLAPENVTPETLQQNTFGLVTVNANASIKVGALFGTLGEGCVVQNANSQLKLVVNQTDENALLTVVGGFAGEINNARITNSYASPLDEELVQAGFGSNILGGSGSLVVGGFAGNVAQNVVLITNVFAGGSVFVQNVPEDKTVILGKLFGTVQNVSTEKILNAYSYNQSTLPLIGNLVENDFKVDVLQVGIINNFAADAQISGQLLWNELYEWNTQSVWCKKNLNALPVLQVFESFNVAVRSEQNSVGVSVSILDSGKNPILVDGEPAASIEVKYGQEIYLKIQIQEEFLPYKSIKGLMSTTSTLPFASFNINEKLSSEEVLVTVTGATSAAYFAETYDISYNLKVVSANTNQGEVRVKGATAPVPDNRIFNLSYQSSEAFVAVAANSSYMFEKWVWVGETEESSIDAFVGNPASEILAGYSINLKFGDKSFFNNDVTYVFMKNLAQANIPFKMENGVQTFVLQAQFVPHNEKVNILVSGGDGAAEVYVNGVFVEGQAELDGINFEIDVTVGVAVEIQIIVNQNFVFNGWRVENQSFSSLIKTELGETDKSTIIHLTPTGQLILFADVQQEDKTGPNLSWLWWALGGVGLVGLITVIVVASLKRRKRESFVRYY